MAYENIIQAKTKKIKRHLSESSSESEHETNENFYQFIVLESIEETLIKLSPFLIQKTIETHCKPINIKKTINNIIIQTINQKQSEDTKMEKVWKTKHKNIPSPNPKPLKRSYKIPRPYIMFPWRNKTTS